MWWTPLGDRVLRGAEGRLFQEGLSSLIFFVDTPIEHWIGVSLFDALTVPEQLAALDLYARAMLVEEVPRPELTAIAEATIAAVYEHILIEVQVEIDEDRRDMRRLIRKAAKECEILDSESPKLGCTEMEAWREVMEGLMDRVFWDRDWKEELIDPDDGPDLAEHIRRQMRIDQDYYTAVSPDPPPRRLPMLRESLRKLCMTKLPQ